MSDFEKALHQAAQKAVLKSITEGAWIMPDYHNRVKIPGDIIDDVWALIDTDRLKQQIAKRIEAELADRMVNRMAAEIATDIKQILSVPERREAIRSIARNHMTEIMQAGSPQ